MFSSGFSGSAARRTNRLRPRARRTDYEYGWLFVITMIGAFVAGYLAHWPTR